MSNPHTSQIFLEESKARQSGEEKREIFFFFFGKYTEAVQ